MRNAGDRRRAVRRLVPRPLAGVVAVALVVAGASTAAANEWLPIFRTEAVATVGFGAADLLALPDLRHYGDLEVTRRPDVHEVSGAAAAAAETGLDVPAVTVLPRGVRGEPAYQVGGEADATFTLSGGAGPSVRLRAGPGVVATWTSSAGLPALLVGRAVAPTASSGASFEAVRDHLLSLPGFPAEVARRLRAFSPDGSTVPLPVPTEAVTTATARVHGVPATVLTTRDRTLAAVVWIEAGVVTVVAGSLDADELLSVARRLG